MIKTQRVEYSAPEQQWLVKVRKKQNNWIQFHHEQRREVVQETELQSLVKPGIKPINQVKIFTKWLPLCEVK